jgi:transcriptional regulator with XRE-family HTH domain
MRERINQLVINEGMTAALFAEKVGISPASLSHILNGRNEPTLKVLMKIHEVCGVSLEWLAYGTGEMMEKAKAEESSENEASMFAEIPLFSSITPENLENRKENEVKTGFYGPKEIVREEVKYIEKPARKITEIRIFFDNGTYETFHPDK